MTAAVFWSLVVLVVLAPLPYGAVHHWSAQLLATTTGALLVLWALAAALDRAATVPIRRILPVALPYGLFVAWVFLQAVAWSPAGLHHPVWAGAGAISLDPTATRDVALRLAAYGGIFWMAAHLGDDGGRAYHAFWAIAIAGMAYAVYGLWVQLSGAQTILFAEKWAYHGSLTSTFVNRNHYALYAGLGLVTCFGLLIRYARRDASGALDSPQRFLQGIERLGLPVFVLFAFCAVIATALVLSQSRGGTAFTGLALIALVGLLGGGRRMGRRSALALIGLMLAGGTILVVFSGRQLLVRAVTETSAGTRGPIHAIATDAFLAAPVTGHGAGTFPALFHMFRGEEFAAISPAYAAAHSVYLETLAETGAIGAVLLLAALGAVLWGCIAGTRRRRRHAVFPAVGAAAMVLAGLHSVFDFGPQIPGIAASLAFLLGVSWGQSRRPEDAGLAYDDPARNVSHLPSGGTEAGS